MSDAVALNDGGGNEEELHDDVDDANNTSTRRLMLPQQELEGHGEISGVTERRDTAVPLWRRLTKCLADFVCIGVVVLLPNLFAFLFGGICFLHYMFAMYAFGHDDGWLWTTLILLDLHFVVCTCISVIGAICIELQPSIEGFTATGLCHLGLFLFSLCTLLFGLNGCTVDVFALVFWTIFSPMPAVAWMAPVSMLAVNVWLFGWLKAFGEDRLRACWTWISQRRSTNSVAAQFELAGSSMEKDGAFPTTTDAYHDDRTDTETTISSEVV
jgi:hypothetical protein